MKLLKTIFGFIWLGWGAFWFLMVMVLCTPFIGITLPLFKKRAPLFWVWFLFSKGAPFILFMCGIRMKVYGREGIDASKTYVLVSNHVSQLDPVACGAASPLPAKFLAKKEIEKIPFFGYVTRKLSIMVDRKSKESRERSVQYMMEELKRGSSLLIYAEGTRNRSEEKLKEFKDGAFRVAILSQTPIVVETLVGLKKINHPNKMELFPGKIEVYLSKPIETKGMTVGDLPALKERVKNEMLSHL